MVRARIGRFLLFLLVAVPAAAQLPNTLDRDPGPKAQDPLEVDSVLPWTGGPQCDNLIIGPIEDLLTVKLREDVVLSWIRTPDSPLYNVWYVEDKVAIPLARSGELGIEVGNCFETSASTCIDPLAVGPAVGTLRFYQVRGSCPGSEARE